MKTSSPAPTIVVLELLLLPQPTAKAEIPIAASTAAARLAGFELNNGTSSSLSLDR